MRVKALRPFTGYDTQGVKHRYTDGEEFDLPEGVDWLDKELVAEVEPVEPEEPVEPKVKTRRGAKK